MVEPVHILSLGAGVQSSTIAMMATHGLITPMPVAAIFADTHAEPPAIYAWLDWLEKKLPFPVIRVSKGSLWKPAVTHKTAVPFSTNKNGEKGKLPRSCTRDFKIRPILKAARKLAKIRHGQKTVGVIQWIGFSMDEIVRCKPSQDKWWQARWPLIEMRKSRQWCIEWMLSNGYPEPPRSACQFCPFHSDYEWRRLKEHDPESFQRAVEFEKQLQSNARGKLQAVPFLHDSLKILSEVDLRTDREKGQGYLWQDACDGPCAT